MSAIDDLAGKYLDEIRLLLPVSSIVAFCAGVSLLSHPLAVHSSWWRGLLSLRFADVWHFKDLLTSLRIWEILALTVASLGGSFFSKVLVRSFALVGRSALRRELRPIYVRAVTAAKQGQFKKSTFKAARNWRSSREGGLWGRFKLASFAFSMALISLLVCVRSLSLFDFLTVTLFIFVGIYLAWKFSSAYFSTYLPERIMTDAALGLIEPRLLEDVEQSTRA